MPQYFFHTEGSSRFSDEEGVTFENEDDVAGEALAFLAESLRGHHVAFWESSSYRVIVTDEQGLIVYVLDLSGIEAPAIRKRRRSSLDAAQKTSGK